jgi:hypothetical protein
MGRSVVWMCVLVASTIGGFVPELWGASSFSLQSLVFGAAGAFAGLWLGVRLNP